jgi:hypothetical protein
MGVGRMDANGGFFDHRRQRIEHGLVVMEIIWAQKQRGVQLAAR